RAVVRVAQEKRVPARKAVIQSKAELVFQQRGGSDAAEVSEIPEQRGARDSPLIVTFPVGKEEQAVAADRAAERKTVLLPLKKWIRVGRDALESRVGGQRMIAEEIESGTGEVVATRTSKHVDGAAGGEAC